MSSTPHDQYLAVCQELERLRADLAAARAEAKINEDALQSACVKALNERDALRADLAAARADAERYRWLRSTNAFTLLAIAWSHPAAQAIGEDCDSAIDAAIAGEKK